MATLFTLHGQTPPGGPVDSALGHQNGPEEAAWAPAEPGDPPPAQIQRQLEIITSTLAVYH